MSEHRYRIVIAFDPDKEQYVARAPELPACQAEGDTPAAALEAVSEEITAQVENIRESGGRVPEPIDEVSLSGEVTLQISQSLHRELRWLSLLEEMDEAALAAEIFRDGLKHRLRTRPRRLRPAGGPPSEADAEGQPPADRPPREEGRGRGRGRGRGARGSRYHQIMEDKASFLEYVRGLESGGGGGGRGGRGGGRRR